VLECGWTAGRECEASLKRGAVVVIATTLSYCLLRFETPHRTALKPPPLRRFVQLRARKLAEAAAGVNDLLLTASTALSSAAAAAAAAAATRGSAGGGGSEGGGEEDEGAVAGVGPGSALAELETEVRAVLCCAVLCCDVLCCAVL